MTEYTIDKIGALGDGIVSSDQGDIFAPFALPREKITGDVENGRIQNPRIVMPVPERIKPICRHFKTCGGCTMQHANDVVLANWKMQKTKDALTTVGLYPEFRRGMTVPLGSRRRATFAVKRTKKGAMIGFHGRASDTIVEITECPVSDPELLSCLPALKEMAILGASRKAPLRASVTASENGLDVSIEGGKKLDASDIAKLAKIAGSANIIRLFWNHETAVQSSPPIHTINSVKVSPPSGSFLQATKEGETILIDAVQGIVSSSKKVVDFFSGCGTFALPLAKNAEVLAIEGSGEMLMSLDHAWRGSTGLKDIKTEKRDLFRRPLQADELMKVDAVVLDPPRAGALAQVQELIHSNVKKIAFVSCNPATFARDAKVLVDGGYTLNWVQVVDQFLYNPHVELVAEFTK